MKSQNVLNQGLRPNAMMKHKKKHSLNYFLPQRTQRFLSQDAFKAYPEASGRKAKSI